MNDTSRKPPPYSPFSPPEPRKPLTETQERIARMLAEGCVVKQVAAALKLSETTVKYHIRELAVIVALPDSEDLSDRDQVVIWAYWTYRRDRTGDRTA